MSLRYEQHYSLKLTRELLSDLMTTPVSKWNKSDLRWRAHRCARHFPPLTESGMPLFSQDPWTDEDGFSVQHKKANNEDA